jgi:general secretion pathway protein D
VIRDQADLRMVFERKMQERQEFIDRYFVFNAEWSPPRDFTRANGLIEVIRQAFAELEEREHVEEEGKRGDDKVHEPTPPLELAGSVKAGGGTSTRKPKKHNITVTPPSGGKGGKSAPKRAPKGKKRSENESPLLLRPLARSVSPEQQAPLDGRAGGMLPTPAGVFEEERLRIE